MIVNRRIEKRSPEHLILMRFWYRRFLSQNIYDGSTYKEIWNRYYMNMLPLYNDFSIGFGTVPTVWYFLYHN
jgi:hypothetical protein